MTRLELLLLGCLWLITSLSANAGDIDADSDTDTDAGPAPVHVRVESDDDSTWTPATATPFKPPCPQETQDKLTLFTLHNIALHRRCYDQSGGVNAFPFDLAPSRDHLVRLSASAACLMVSKAVLRVVEHECDLGGDAMPVRATAETVLKLHQDRKDLTTYPIPSDAILQQHIQQRAAMNRERDEDPIGFSVDLYPPEMQQYEAQLTKSYADGIVLLSSELQILNDLSDTEQTGSEAAAAAVSELDDTSTTTSSSDSSSGSSGSEEATTGSQTDKRIPWAAQHSQSGRGDQGSSMGEDGGGSLVQPPVASSDVASPQFQRATILLLLHVMAMLVV